MPEKIDEGSLLASAYLLLALFSEVKEFPTFNANARALLVTGLVYFGSTLMVSGLMLYRYTVVEE